MNLDFYREIHEKEFRRKDSLAQRASVIITGLTTLGGFLAFVIVNYKQSGNAISVFFQFLAAVSLIALGTSAYYLIRSYYVPTLNDIAKPIEWINYWKELLVKYKNSQGTFASADEEFSDYLINLYATIAGENIDANDKRGERLVRSNFALLSAFALVVLTSLVFYYGNNLSREEAKMKGVDQMFTAKDALVCIPAAWIAESDTKPGKRPVPDPAPPKRD